MPESFRSANRHNTFAKRSQFAEEARHLERSQPTGFVLEYLQFLRRWITVFHAGNIGPGCGEDKR
jgi:hypothetical protein